MFKVQSTRAVTLSLEKFFLPQIFTDFTNHCRLNFNKFMAKATQHDERALTNSRTVTLNLSKGSKKFSLLAVMAKRDNVAGLIG